MIFRLSSAFLLLGLCSGALAGWREDARDLRAGNFPPPPASLVSHYVFGWSGIEAAEADFTLRRGDDGTWHGTARGGTKGVARSLWKLDASYDVNLAESNWVSLDSRQIERYSSYTLDEKAVFLPGGVRSWRESTKEGAKRPKWRNFYVEGMRDIAGALLLARSQSLNEGDTITLAVFPGEWMYLVRVHIERREKINWRGKERAAIRASFDIDSIEKNYSLTPHKKFQRGTVWVSDDEIRLPLRIEVKVFVGYVFAELVSIKTSADADR